MLNCPALFDNEPNRNEISDSTIQKLFDSDVRRNEPVNNNNRNIQKISNNISVKRLADSLSQVSRYIHDE